MSARPALGIDLGTTNSVVAQVGEDGVCRVLSNANGDSVTPSVVYFRKPEDALVGTFAREAMLDDPVNGVALIKRQMGTDFPLRLHDVEHTPESISALILRHLVASTTGSPDGARAVITVPAYFGLSEKEATHTAGLIAGIEVLELVAEPVAAALHYGFSTSGTRTVLVYDLGGGTFDTTVLRIDDTGFRVVATDGDRELGGADVDRRLFDRLIQRLAALMSEEDLDSLLNDESQVANLLLDVEFTKRRLSRGGSREITVGLPVAYSASP